MGQVVWPPLCRAYRMSRVSYVVPVLRILGPLAPTNEAVRLYERYSLLAYSECVDASPQRRDGPQRSAGT